MGLFGNLFKQKEQLVLPDACVLDILDKTKLIIDWAQKWNEYATISVVPGTSDGCITYHNQTGLIILWYEEELLQSYQLVADDGLMEAFDKITDQFGDPKMFHYHALPFEVKGEEAKYMSWIVDQLKSEYSNLEIMVGSQGRQLTIVVSDS